MPIITAAASLPVIAGLFWMVAASIVVNRPESADMYCIMGAGPAAICALLAARTKAMSLVETARIFIGSSAIGMFGPGVTYGLLRWWNWIPANAAEYITWHFWALAGFLFATGGWGLIHKINEALSKRADRLADAWDRYFHSGEDKPSGPPPASKQ